MARKKRSRSRSKWQTKFGKAARDANRKCAVELVKKIEAGQKVSAKSKKGHINPIGSYFKCVGREVKKAL